MNAGWGVSLGIMGRLVGLSWSLSLLPPRRQGAKPTQDNFKIKTANVAILSILFWRLGVLATWRLGTSFTNEQQPLVTKFEWFLR